MEYFEVPEAHPGQDGICSDNSCPCGFPGAKIPRGSGYLYIPKEVVDFRQNAKTVREAEVKIAMMRGMMGGANVMFDPAMFTAILMCEQGARKRGLDLDVAAADARYWWQTGLAPLRATPLAGAPVVIPAAPAPVKPLVSSTPPKPPALNPTPPPFMPKKETPIPVDVPQNFKTFAHLISLIIPGALLGWAISSSGDLNFFAGILVYTGLMAIYYALVGGFGWKKEKVSTLRIVVFAIFSYIILGAALVGFWYLVRYLLAKVYKIPMPEARGRLFMLSNPASAAAVAARVAYRPTTPSAPQIAPKAGSTPPPFSTNTPAPKPAAPAPIPTAPKPIAIAPANLRLADPKHPARQQILAAADYLRKGIEIKSFEGSTSYVTTFANNDLDAINQTFAEALALAPADLDLLVAQANILHAHGQFKTAEEILDRVLQKDPNHFEAKNWKEHWETWGCAWKYPLWDENLSLLHPMMQDQFNHGLMCQVVRDGLQKTIAIIGQGQGFQYSSDTQVKLRWVLSKTPLGNIIAYYLQILDPQDEPHTRELFITPRAPRLFTPTEGFYLIQQLAFTPYCYVILANQGKVMLNRKVILGGKPLQEVRDMAKLLAEHPTQIEDGDIKAAGKWHMDNFDMDHMTFD